MERFTCALNSLWTYPTLRMAITRADGLLNGLPRSSVMPASSYREPSSHVRKIPLASLKSVIRVPHSSCWQGHNDMAVLVPKNQHKYSGMASMLLQWFETAFSGTRSGICSEKERAQDAVVLKVTACW
ncbi:hypothetical protein MPH_11010 [Macrophomina phaseolina MS6]|uniref:Uncharacterized protein n=1 Tax=Macrophomina phaseolina (strain MS6) TaxID=1126212 RepID=K2RBE3_MACPH|nr:hypothetical protein MPH_11010 [Macrophomina phaseolina MS6]